MQFILYTTNREKITYFKHIISSNRQQNVIKECEWNENAHIAIFFFQLIIYDKWIYKLKNLNDFHSVSLNGDLEIIIKKKM